MTTKKTAPATEKPDAKPAATKKPEDKAPAKATAKATAKKPRKEHKEKVVRDSFTMPQSEYLKIAEIKGICLKAGMPVKKSEILRAGLKALGAMSAAQLKQALTGVEKIKTGRPKKP